MPNTLKKRLVQILGDLPENQAQALLEFAEFLAARHVGPAVATTPLSIPRPPQESVVRAIKRLGATYPMVDRSRLLNETSALMTQHVIHGRSAAEVIDELEILFRQQYEMTLPPGSDHESR